MTDAADSIIHLMRNKVPNPAYRKAFENYLRWGTPIHEPYYLEKSELQNDVPAVYVWRTKGDDKVRHLISKIMAKFLLKTIHQILVIQVRVMVVDVLQSLTQGVLRNMLIKPLLII